MENTRKSFHRSVKDFIYGIDEKGLGKLGLARKNLYRILAGLYMIRTTEIPEKEIPKMIEFLKKVVKKFDNPEIKDFANEIIEEMSLK